MKNIRYLTLLYLLSFPTLAAVELSEHVTLSGFGSTSVAVSDNETPLLVNRAINDSTCFDCDTTFGLQLDYYHNAFKASAQLVKRPQDNWSEPQLEWAYLAYSHENFQFRGGRLRMPLFLASEYYFVGHAYPSARPAAEVYNSVLGITAYNGLSVIWNHELNDTQSVIATPFFGLRNESNVNYNPNTELDITTNRMWGINVVLSGDNYRWNLTYMNADYDRETILTNTIMDIPGSEAMFVDKMKIVERNQNIQLASLGVSYELDSLSLTAEGQVNDVVNAWYVSASYNINSFTSYMMYGQQLSADEAQTGSSYGLGLRYDLLYNVSLNAEWQYFKARDDEYGAFIYVPEDNDANLYTLMMSFVF
ncbi:porin [Vibrio sp. CAU 1672]|uniref:outer membrane protein n=1 Tax=Vibrio sp. CAU 1672 TaxID=3032594 RepID=UPI0023D9E1FB|nr:porin [Vibrio sp. CAU 1672]MDF2152232.1 porin [Vibrio sp. CAU 1672]